jgi:hypothetical protein
MAKFCVKCRAALDVDAKFCEECGEPVRPPRAAQAAPATGQPRAVPLAATAVASAPTEINWRKVALWSGVGLGVLVVGGGVAAFLTMPPSVPTAADIETIINANTAKVAEATCLSNFSYDKNPVMVSSFDVNTQQWLAVLSRAGIYSAPQRVTNASMFGGSLQYSHTAEGEKKIHQGKLCFADGLTVASVQFVKPVKVGKQWHTRGTYNYGYRHADAWIQKPDAQRIVPDRFADLPKTSSIALVKGEHGWEIDNGSAYGDAATSNGLNSIVNGLAQRALERAAAEGDADDSAASYHGVFSKLGAMVSGLFGSNPILVGKWRSDNDGYGTLEFTHDSATVQGSAVPVTYEKDSVDNKRIRVKANDGSTLATIELIDDDQFYISLTFGRARFHRVS